MHVYMYTCMFVCLLVCIYVCRYVCMNICVYIQIYVSIHVRMNVCMYLLMYVNILVCMYLYVHMWLYVSTYVYVNTCVWIMYVLTCVSLNVYTGFPRRKGPNFERVFLRSNDTDITQNTYIQRSMVTEILATEFWNVDRYYSLIHYQIHIETGRNMWFL